MRALKLLAVLALAACNNTPEAAPVDSGPLLRDIVAADAPADATTPVDVPADVPAPTDAQAPTDVPAPTDAQDAAAPGDIPDVSTLADVPTPDAAADGGAPDASCVADGGCYACPPTAPEHFLNRCTTAACAPFDNRARLTRLLADGGLPPLP